MTLMKHTFSSTWDIDYILSKVEGIDQYNISSNDGEGNATLSYTGTQEQFDAVSAIIEAYPTTYANDVVKPSLLADVTTIRNTHMATTVYEGMTLKCDDPTIGRLTAAVVLVDCDPDGPQTRRWKIDDDTWVTLDRSALVGIGNAIATHMQVCFDREEVLRTAIKTASDITELAEIDINAGWDEDAETS